MQDLFDSKDKADNHKKLISFHGSFDYIAKIDEKMPPSTNKYEFVKILDIFNEILAFNEQNQWGQGLKVLILSEMLSRLPICLAQLKAGNYLEKLKNETRQLLYSLYRSKKLTKNINKSLIDII